MPGKHFPQRHAPFPFTRSSARTGMHAMTTHCRTRRTLFSSIPRKLIAHLDCRPHDPFPHLLRHDRGCRQLRPLPRNGSRIHPRSRRPGRFHQPEQYRLNPADFRPGRPKNVAQTESQRPQRGRRMVGPRHGGQAPVRIKRLPSSPQGAQRIKVMVGPIPDTKESPPSIWIYELQRTNGGWIQPIPTS